ncbi:TetR family regulatory protein [Caballeronia udeis]|uniref:TetR family regulatory protein n=1 Tax=Caballeronia udeis TaxID=1232866 RepID=A0A158JZ98_9BURK|nr:TetR/AcrR family transcriptional regulator [Caballeronia udeis]SAL74232.1 TetR family regulatory protein [Caballeronia udeis]
MGKGTVSKVARYAKPTRLTREQSRDLTRQRLLDAARGVFLSDGFAAASLEDITAAAGYTRGAFYSNFGCKQQLLLELLARDQGATMARMRTIFDDQTLHGDMGSYLIQYYCECYRDNESHLLWTEAKLQATRDARFRARFNVLMRNSLQAATTYLAALAERMGPPLPLSAAELALGLSALFDGLQFYCLSNPQAGVNTNELIKNILTNLCARSGDVVNSSAVKERLQV